MKRLFVFLCIMLSALQYDLWLSQGNVLQVRHLMHQLQQEKSHNQTLVDRNAELFAEISDLKLRLEAVEERAREELGLIKASETFYLFAKKK